MSMWKSLQFRRSLLPHFRLLVAGVLAQALLGQVPISLQASARKARTIVGESITIELRQSLSSDLDMESVELNRDRTSIEITRQGAPGKVRVLSGKDYVALHHPEPLTQIGTSFHGKAGTTWTSELNVFEYTYPLAAGRYGITVSYRFGNDPSSVVRANQVAIEVAPAELVTARFRWFGGAAARQELDGLWAAKDAGRTRWFYQVSEAADPAAVVSAIELGWSIPSGIVPRLALLNDIAQSHFTRIAVWTKDGQLCRQKVSDSGALGSASCADTGLKPGPTLRLADPPLQLRDDGLAAVVTGDGGADHQAASLVRVSAEGKAEHRLVPIGLAFASEGTVVWSESEEAVQGTVYGLARQGSGQAAVANQLWRVDLGSGKRETILQTANEIAWVGADQWLRTARVYAVVRLGEGAEVRCWSPTPAAPFAISFPITWKLNSAMPLVDGEGLALVAATPNGWAVVTRRERWSGVQASPQVIAAAGGLFILQHAPNRGFYVLHRSDEGQARPH